MKYNKVGSSDLSVSEICLGTMTWGEQNSETEAHQQLDYAVSRGINFVDAAEMYPVPPKAETQGRTEAYLGLKRLQTDYVDLYQIHWPDRYLPLFGNTFYDPGQERATAPIEEQLEAFAGFVKAGKDPLSWFIQ